MRVQALRDVRLTAQWKWPSESCARSASSAIRIVELKCVSMKPVTPRNRHAGRFNRHILHFRTTVSACKVQNEREALADRQGAFHAQLEGRASARCS
jgi:hypothetical protein